jgi:predicted alpha/beta superfamily hydrolase
MKGKILTDNIRDREIIVYLPPSYRRTGAGFSVVYVQDKGDLFDPSGSHALADLEVLFEQGRLVELMLVGVASNDRRSEYTPWPAPALAERYGGFGGRGADYLAFLAHELKPYIDGEYNTLRQPGDTGIAGASLGGLIAAYAAYLYPGVFGRIASISGSFWYQGWIEFMAAQRIAPAGRKIYLDVGSLEGTVKTNVQKEMVPQTRKAHQILRSAGFTAGDCKLVIDEGAVHRQEFFTKRFPSALQWLFTK